MKSVKNKEKSSQRTLHPILCGVLLPKPSPQAHHPKAQRWTIILVMASSLPPFLLASVHHAVYSQLPQSPSVQDLGAGGASPCTFNWCSSLLWTLECHQSLQEPWVVDKLSAGCLTSHSLTLTHTAWKLMLYTFNVNIVKQYSCLRESMQLGDKSIIWPQRLLIKLPHLAGLMERVA